MDNETCFKLVQDLALVVDQSVRGKKRREK